MSQEIKDKIKAWFGTILFHALLILALFFLALKTPLPLPEEEGVEVNLGYSELGQNAQQVKAEEIPALLPQPVEEIVEEVVEEVVNYAPEEEIIKEDTEEAPVIADKPEPKKEPEKKVEKPIEKPKEEKKPKTEKKIEQPKEEIKHKEPEPVVDQRLIYTGRKASSSEGNDQQQGDKGVKTGVLDSPNYTGPGGLGDNGISYNLGDRKASSLPKPTYNSDDQGRVNVRIRVDKNGRVTRADILQKGTTVSDINLHNMAIQAALKAVFAPDSNASEIQVGTITYNFIKLN